MDRMRRIIARLVREDLRDLRSGKKTRSRQPIQEVHGLLGS